MVDSAAPNPVIAKDARVDASVAYRIILPIFALFILAFFVYFLFTVPNEIVGIAQLFPPVSSLTQKP